MHTHQREPNPARGIGRTALAFYAMNTVEDSFTYDPTFFTTEDEPTWSIELTDE